MHDIYSPTQFQESMKSLMTRVNHRQTTTGQSLSDDEFELDGDESQTLCFDSDGDTPEWTYEVILWTRIHFVVECIRLTVWFWKRAGSVLHFDVHLLTTSEMKWKMSYTRPWIASLLNRAQNNIIQLGITQHNPFVLWSLWCVVRSTIVFVERLSVVGRHPRRLHNVKVWLRHQELVLYSQLAPFHHAILT